MFQGIGGLNKLGSGTLILSGSSAYEGLTAIEDGALKLDETGSIDNTSGVSLGIDGTFVTITAIPEPRVMFLCSLGVLFFLCRRRAWFPGNRAV